MAATSFHLTEQERKEIEHLQRITRERLRVPLSRAAVLRAGLRDYLDAMRQRFQREGADWPEPPRDPETGAVDWGR